MDPTTKTQLWAKVTSGKWLLTLTAGFCLGAVTVTDCMLAFKGEKLFVDPAALLSIITAIVLSYFGRTPDKPVTPDNTDPLASSRKPTTA